MKFSSEMAFESGGLPVCLHISWLANLLGAPISRSDGAVFELQKRIACIHSLGLSTSLLVIVGELRLPGDFDAYGRKSATENFTSAEAPQSLSPPKPRQTLGYKLDFGATGLGN